MVMDPVVSAVIRLTTVDNLPFTHKHAHVPIMASVSCNSWYGLYPESLEREEDGRRDMRRHGAIGKEMVVKTV